MKMAANRLRKTMVTIGMRMDTEETTDTDLEATVSVGDEAMGDGTVRLMVMVKHIRTTAMEML